MSKRKKSIKTSKSAKKPKEALLHIVKRRGHTEAYDEKKVYGSCYFACRNAHLSEQESEEIASKVANEITKWLRKKKTVTSDQIFKNMAFALKKYNEDVAFLYETHRDLS